jgi:hypothetical protein
MPAFLLTWPPEQVLILALILSGAVCLLALILAVLRYNMRVLTDATLLQRERLEADLALKRELIQRGLPPQELEQTIKLLKLDEPPSVAPHQPGEAEAAEAEFVKAAVLLEKVPPEGLEEVVALLRAADEPRKCNALSVVREFVDNGVEGPVALAALRSLLRSEEKPRGDGRPLELSTHITR